MQNWTISWKLLHTNYSTLYFFQDFSHQSGHTDFIRALHLKRNLYMQSICTQEHLLPMAYPSSVYSNRSDSGLEPSQWETLLQRNAISHWLGSNLESALLQYSSTATGHVALAVITGTTILMPYRYVKSLQLTWGRAPVDEWNLWVLHLQMSCKD